MDKPAGGELDSREGRFRFSVSPQLGNGSQDKTCDRVSPSADRAVADVAAPPSSPSGFCRASQSRPGFWASGPPRSGHQVTGALHVCVTPAPGEGLNSSDSDAAGPRPWGSRAFPNASVRPVAPLKTPRRCSSRASLGGSVRASWLSKFMEKLSGM